MKNIWLNINLTDYENHMALQSVAQAQYLSKWFSEVLNSFQPKSVAILGCSGGNGLEKMDDKKIEKVICVDINPDFVRETENRYKKIFSNIEFICNDIASENFKLPKVDFIYAGLIFEYVNIKLAISNISEFINANGILAVVIQQPNENIAEVSPSPYKSLEKLSQLFRFINVTEFIELCNNYNLELISQKETELASSKIFTELLFKKIN